MKNLFVCTDAENGKWGLWTENAGSVDLVSDLFVTAEALMSHMKENGLSHNIDYDHPFGMAEDEVFCQIG